MRCFKQVLTILSSSIRLNLSPDVSLHSRITLDVSVGTSGLLEKGKEKMTYINDDNVFHQRII